MNKVCSNCGRMFEGQSEINFCSDDGGYLIPENLKHHFSKNASVGSWMIRFLIAGIPLVGLIFLIVWANDSTDNSRKNWAIANLIWTVILIFFSLLVGSIIISKIL